MDEYLKETHMLNYSHLAIQKLIHDKHWDEINKFAQFKKSVALGYLIQQKYHNDIRNTLP